MGIGKPAGRCPVDQRKGSQNGIVRIWRNGSLVPQPFLDLRASISTGGERGLLGLAFHPDFETNRGFFVYYTDREGRRQLSEFEATVSDPSRAGARTT